MDKKQLVSGILLGTLLFLPMLSFAETDAPTGAREMGTGKATGRMVAPPPMSMTATGTKAELLREAREQGMENARRQQREYIRQSLKRIPEMLVKRMHAAIERLLKLANRLDSRIAKEKARGVDTSVAETNLAVARTKIADARTAVNIAAAAIPEALVTFDASASSTKPIDIFKSVREELSKAKDAVFAAHKALVEAIASLKGTREKMSTTTVTQ